MEQRTRWARGLNLLLPGTGHILLQREWLGLMTAILYGIAMQIALAGALIAPGSIPRAVWWTSAGLAAFVWLAAQWTLRCQARWVRSEARRRELERLRREASEALAHDDPESAWSSLCSAAELDDEDPQIVSMMAAVLERRGDAAQAARLRRSLRSG